MVNLVISLPVHEKAEVILDQMLNFKHFCPTCAVVLHISKGFNWKDSLLNEEEFLSALSTFDNVFVNPTRFETLWTNLIHTWISNFEYISGILDFEYYALSVSNELFVRPMPPISDFDLCATINFDRSYKVATWDSWYEKLFKDEYIYKLVQYLGGTADDDVCKSQVEGSFYRKEIFQQIIDVIKLFYSYEDALKKDKILYPREEFYFSTISHLLNKTANFKVRRPNYGFVAWRNKDILPTHEQIIEASQGKMEGIYSVKRVLRNLDNPERVFIGTQIGNYREQLINLLINAKGNRPHFVPSLFNL